MARNNNVRVRSCSFVDRFFPKDFSNYGTTCDSVVVQFHIKCPVEHQTASVPTISKGLAFARLHLYNPFSSKRKYSPTAV